MSSAVEAGCLSKESPVILDYRGRLRPSTLEFWLMVQVNFGNLVTSHFET